MQEVQETPVQSLGWEDTLQEGMATHSSILVWRIPWTEKPGGLQSVGSHTAGHNWSDWACVCPRLSTWRWGESVELSRWAQFNHLSPSKWRPLSMVREKEERSAAWNREATRQGLWATTLAEWDPVQTYELQKSKNKSVPSWADKFVIICMVATGGKCIQPIPHDHFQVKSM